MSNQKSNFVPNPDLPKGYRPKLDPQAKLKNEWESRFIKLCGRTIKGIRYPVG